MCERLLRIRPGCGRIHSACLKRCDKYVQTPGKRCKLNHIVQKQIAVLGCCRECTKIYAEALHLPKTLNLEFAEGVDYMELDTYKYVAALPRPPVEKKEDVISFEVDGQLVSRKARSGAAALATINETNEVLAEKVRAGSVCMTG